MKRLNIILAVALLSISGQLSAQVIIEWVDTRSSLNADEIALGYPVPIPVDTALPFDGFRSYAGLHARHQDLAATTPWVHPEAIGTTRKGRTIWAYRLGDDDLLTVDGLPEPAMLTNGGIHAREWQTPEVVTGILELLALHDGDHHLYDYLRDNVNMIVIPSLNIDGFLQTQRYPVSSYLQTDPDNPGYSPRDGRMRRKNMLSTDENLNTLSDHLNGVDLNRNNNPFWATMSGDRSSPDLRSIVHHGTSPASEPEIQALDAAAHLGPIDRLRIYTDVHSYSLVQYWTRTSNSRLTQQTEKVLATFADHHVAFPARKFYAYSSASNVAFNSGLGTTAEYFTFTYQVPSSTLEVEPSGGQTFHSPLPGGGADYGGVGENGHDGFILPESEIRRVREQLAQSFAAVYYRQAGPPIIKTMRILDKETGSVVFEAEWDVIDKQSRNLYSRQLLPLEIARPYDLWLAFNKPMRWREDGVVVPFPGQPANTLDVEASFIKDATDLSVTVEESSWLEQPGDAPDGYLKYQDDALRLSFSLADDTQNRSLITSQTEVSLKLRTSDMTGMRTDANPATVADWNQGAWSKYENSSGIATDTGGFDTNISLQVTNQDVSSPFQLVPGITASWYDQQRSGEGYVIQILANEKAVMYWFTFDANGEQDWYAGIGEIRGNRIVFPEILRVSGGEFGPGFDPTKITNDVVGSASFVWSSCDEAEVSYQIGTQHEHLQLTRLTRLAGVQCGAQSPLPPESPEQFLSGSWYDPSHSGEGYIIEVLDVSRVVVYWFSFDKQGNRRWFFGLGEIQNGKFVFNDMQTASGGVFGPAFDPDAVEYQSWGSMEIDIDCDQGTASYDSSEEGFGSGILNVVRLTFIDELTCTQ